MKVNVILEVEIEVEGNINEAKERLAKNLLNTGYMSACVDDTKSFNYNVKSVKVDQMLFSCKR